MPPAASDWLTLTAEVTDNWPLKLELVSPRVLLMAPLDSVLVTLPVVDGALTVTRRVHEPLAPIVAPLSVKAVSPAVAVKVPLTAPLPVHVKELAAGPTTVSPPVRVSVKVLSGKVTALGLLSVSTRVEFSPTTTDEGEKLTEPVGALRLFMANVAVDRVLLLTGLPPSSAVKAPTAIVRPRLVPTAVDVTCTDHTHRPSLDCGM